MENNLNDQATIAFDEMVINGDELLNHWQGHRRLTRRVIEAFPEDKLFTYSIGGMRPFGVMAEEMIGLAGAGIRGVVTNDWTPASELEHHSGEPTTTKQGLLQRWDKITAEIDEWWPQIPEGRFQEKMLAFGQWEMETYSIILYWIENEVHHRGQGYVYLRSLGIEPPPFWER